jgi:hypothetical protein
MAPREIICRICTQTIAIGEDESRSPKSVICQSCRRRLDAEAGVGDFAEADLDSRRMYWNAEQHVRLPDPSVCAKVRTSAHEGAQPQMVPRQPVRKTAAA